MRCSQKQAGDHNRDTWAHFFLVFGEENSCNSLPGRVFSMDVPLKTSLFEICPSKEVLLYETLIRIAIPFVIGGFYILLCLLFMPYDSALLPGGLMMGCLVLQGSSGIGGSLVVWMNGLSSGRTLLAITIGAFPGCTLIAIGSQVIRDLLLSNPVAGIVAPVAVIAIFVISYSFYRWENQVSDRSFYHSSPMCMLQ